MNTRFFGAVAVFVSLMATGTHAAADASLYRWKDSEGNPVMSDRPPPVGTEYETISTNSSVVQRVEDGAETTPATAPPPKKPARTAATQPSNTLYEKNPEYCETAKKNLEVIDRAPRIRVDDGEGGLRYISDEERATQRQNNIDIIEAHCE